MGEPIKNRYEFVVLFDVEMEIQMEIRMRGICQELIRSGLGLVTDVCLKTQDS